MTVAVRMLVLTVLGLGLLSGCGGDGDDAAPEAQTSSVTTSQATAGTTGSTGSADEDPVSVTLYDADFTVDASGDLFVVETLTLDVPVDDRHGIYRTFDPGVAIESFTATLDGSPTPVTDTAEDGDRVFRIGDPDQTLDAGEHSVRMEYRVADVLTRSSKGEELDWWLVPDGWSLDILASDLSASLPSEASQARCAIDGPQPCEVSGVGSRTLSVVTDELAAGTGVRLQALMPTS